MTPGRAARAASVRCLVVAAADRGGGWPHHRAAATRLHGLRADDELQCTPVQRSARARSGRQARAPRRLRRPRPAQGPAPLQRPSVDQCTASLAGGWKWITPYVLPVAMREGLVPSRGVPVMAVT